MTKATLAQLQREFAQVSRQANARIDSLKKGRLRSPAYEKLRSEGVTRFGVKAQGLKTEADYRRAIRQARNFLEAKTSTRKGLKKVTTEMMRNFGLTKKGGESWSTVTKKARKLFDLYDDLKQMYENGELKSGDKYELIEMMSSLYDEGIIDGSTSASEIAGRLNKMIVDKHSAVVRRQSTLNYEFRV